jgi:ADP-ribose pyrophosphatase YjhB (NUDIX family)
MKYGTMTYLVSKNNNVLMIKKEVRENDPNSGYFTLPGGKLEIYEKGLMNPRGRLKSAIREAGDETGYAPVNPVLRGVILFDNKDRKFLNWPNPDNFYVYIFAATKYRKVKRDDKSNEGVPVTVPLSRVKEVPSNPGDKKMYEWLEDGRNFIGVIKHKGEELNPEGTFVDFF